MGEAAKGFLGLLFFRVSWSGEVCVGDGLVGTCSVFAWQRDRACARRKAQEGVVFALCARGFRVFAFNARSGSIPLLPLGGAVGGVWDG